MPITGDPVGVVLNRMSGSYILWRVWEQVDEWKRTAFFPLVMEVELPDGRAGCLVYQGWERQPDPSGVNEAATAIWRHNFIEGGWLPGPALLLVYHGKFDRNAMRQYWSPRGMLSFETISGRAL